MKEQIIIQESFFKKSFLISISFLIIVITITLSLHVYNNSIIYNNQKIKSNISLIDKSIFDIWKNKKLQTYNLLIINKEIINSFNLLNNINKYIVHMNNIWAKYNIDLIGFNLTKWIINTSIKILPDSNIINNNNKFNKLSYQKASYFINDYRKDENALFELDFIKSIQWVDEMRFNITFKIK